MLHYKLYSVNQVCATLQTIVFCKIGSTTLQTVFCMLCIPTLRTILYTLSTLQIVLPTTYYRGKTCIQSPPPQKKTWKSEIHIADLNIQSMHSSVPFQWPP
jgi:hypothetical protein